MVLDPTSASANDANAANIPSNALSMRLYSSVGVSNNRDATELVLTQAKSSFPELRLGAYELLRSVAKRGTGAQILLTHGGFYEWLINREGEATKEGREAKFQIVRAVLG